MDKAASQGRSIEMLHPSIHFEIARQRHQDLLAEVERLRIAEVVDDAAVTPTARRLQRLANASRSAFDAARHTDVEAGLEVRAHATHR
jgi:hypothetical protein